MPPLRALVGLLVTCGYAIIVSSIWLGPPPFWLTVGLALSIAVSVNVGVAMLNWQLFVNCTVRGRAGAKQIALTFDDGPHPEHTREVLRALGEAKVRGTFFLVGHKVDRHPEVVREIVAQGHEIGLHSHAHDYLMTLRSEARILSDLHENQEAIARATGQRPVFFRPPVGLTSPRIRTAVEKLGLEVIGWSARAFDGIGQPSPEAVLARLSPQLEDGAIVLLHDCRERSEARPSSLDALRELLAQIQARDLQGVTLSELLSLPPSDSDQKH